MFQIALSVLPRTISDNFLSPIPVSDWLIFCGGILILYQKKKRTWKKHNFYDEKQQQEKVKKSMFTHKAASFILNSPHWPVM